MIVLLSSIGEAYAGMSTYLFKLNHINTPLGELGLLSTVSSTVSWSNPLQFSARSVYLPVSLRTAFTIVKSVWYSWFSILMRSVFTSLMFSRHDLRERRVRNSFLVVLNRRYLEIYCKMYISLNICKFLKLIGTLAKENRNYAFIASVDFKRRL